MILRLYRYKWYSTAATIQIALDTLARRSTATLLAHQTGKKERELTSCDNDARSWPSVSSYCPIVVLIFIAGIVVAVATSATVPKYSPPLACRLPRILRMSNQLVRALLLAGSATSVLTLAREGGIERGR
ncbi:hypothetical protein R3P38DRAFT_2836014 [Favolaschia claudopus]|uniref:Uncharacterized protein n=1 Tax=Favolaschia claudopus TaxID=2862362 RepID=A0AAW0E507_9AGAR